MRFRLLVVAALLGFDLSTARAEFLQAEAAQVEPAARTRHPTIELRMTPPRLRPYGFPSLCPMLAVPVAGHVFAGAGYELVQDYDVAVWTGRLSKEKPAFMSGLRLGAWYRGGADRYGFSMAVGGILTFAHRSFSLDTSPKELDRSSYALDIGPDFSFGYVLYRVRFEIFATPAWSWGRFVTTKMPDQVEHMSRFTYRVGVGLAFLLGK